MNYLIKNGRVIDPANNIDDALDVLVVNGKISELNKNLNNKQARIIDANGNIVSPGLIDMHTHLREPGREDEETIATGTRAAVRGGYSAITCMPNTEPAVDNVKTARFLKDIIKKTALCRVFVVGAITEGRIGKALTNFKALKKEGIVALSDDGSSLDDSGLLLEALKEAKRVSLFIIEHCEDSNLSSGGVINHGFVATKMGLRGISRQSEYERAARDIELAKKASSSIHIAHVSLKESVDIIRKAKRDGVDVTCETCPHYFALTEDCSATYDTNTKMNPPLRTAEDVKAVKEGLADGTIDVIATDHAPHTDSEKDVEFDFAPFGIIGLETALSITATELVAKNAMSWRGVISKMSVNPARILNIKGGTLKRGSPADITIIDPGKEYIYKKNLIESKSKNSPFIDWKLKAKVSHLFVDGRLVMEDEMIT